MSGKLITLPEDLLLNIFFRLDKRSLFRLHRLGKDCNSHLLAIVKIAHQAQETLKLRLRLKWSHLDPPIAIPSRLSSLLAYVTPFQAVGVLQDRGVVMFQHQIFFVENERITLITGISQASMLYPLHVSVNSKLKKTLVVTMDIRNRHHCILVIDWALAACIYFFVFTESTDDSQIHPKNIVYSERFIYGVSEEGIYSCQNRQWVLMHMFPSKYWSKESTGGTVSKVRKHYQIRSVRVPQGILVFFFRGFHRFWVFRKVFLYSVDLNQSIELFCTGTPPLVVSGTSELLDFQGNATFFPDSPHRLSCLTSLVLTEIEGVTHGLWMNTRISLGILRNKTLETSEHTSFYTFLVQEKIMRLFRRNMEIMSLQVNEIEESKA